MTPIEKYIDIIKTMIEYGMVDRSRLNDADYVVERVKIYLEAKGRPRFFIEKYLK